MNYSTDDLYLHFKGEWSFSRTYSTGERASGRAIFSELDEGILKYSEEGQFDGDNSGFWRNYYYSFKDNGFEIYFDELMDKLFQDVVLDKNGQSSCVHDCPPDIYRSTYEVIEERMFQVSHNVTGPRKNYILSTQYTKTS